MRSSAPHTQNSTAEIADTSNILDAALAAEMDSIVTAIAGVEASLKPLWKSARTSPAVARVVAEALRAMVDLHLERGAFEERLRI